MIAGHLQIKNDYYYMVLSYLDANGKRKQPWFPTGLPIKNNKKRAEKMLLELRQTYFLRSVIPYISTNFASMVPMNMGLRKRYMRDNKI